MSEEVTRRTLSTVLYNQHAGLQQNHATRTHTPLEPRPSDAHPPGYNADLTQVYTHTHMQNKNKKLYATVVLEAQLRLVLQR